MNDDDLSKRSDESEAEDISPEASLSTDSSLDADDANDLEAHPDQDINPEPNPEPKPDHHHIQHVLRMARAYAADRLPWFATALYTARLVITEHCPSLAAIDGQMRVYFNPRLVAELLGTTEETSDRPAEHYEQHDGDPSEHGEVHIADQLASGLCRTHLEELGFVWVHEISHAIRDHRSRAMDASAEPLRWNVAADLEINDSAWSGLSPPKSYPPLLPKQFDLPEGQLAEWYYDQLPPTQILEIVCDEGSGVHGHIRVWELGGGKRDGLTPTEVELLRDEVARAIQQHKSRGTVPAGWRRWADDHLTPQVNWREVLKRRLRGACVVSLGSRQDYSFQRANRRAAQYKPYIRPTLAMDNQPRISCVVDTSGSMSDAEIGQALVEVREVLQSLRVPVKVIPCDAVPYESVELLTQGDYVKLHNSILGGGGTNMVAGIDHALSQRPTPDVIIVLTDGYTPFPKGPAKVPVIFGILYKESCEPALPPMPPWKKSDVVPIEVKEVETVAGK